MPSVNLLVSRLPGHEFAIRRLYAREPEFRAICDDYGLVRYALEHWLAIEPAMPGRVAEYRRMLAEFEAEALAFVRASGTRGRSAGAGGP